MLPEPGLVTARFKYSNGSLIDVATIFLIEHNRNAVFTFYKGDKIHYNPDAANSIVIITQDDEIGLLTKEKFAELKGNVNQFTFAPEFTANNSGKLEQLLKSL
jgi:paraquat-inducible protein B